jgi:hypothetical protein
MSVTPLVLIKIDFWHDIADKPSIGSTIHPFATPGRTTDGVDPAHIQTVSADPGEQSDEAESPGNDLPFVPLTAGCSHRP